MADSEIYRVEIPIIVNDQTEAPFRKAEERVSRFQRNAEKSNRMVRERMLSLAKLQVEPVLKVRDQLTNGVLKADKLIKRLGAEKASPLIEAQDRVSAVVTRINAVLKALDKGDVKVLAEMKGPLMDEIVKAKSSLAALNNVKSGPVAELRGELFGQLSKAMSQLRDIDRLHVEPRATLWDRVTMKTREIGSGLRQLTSKSWTVVLQAKDKATGIIKGVLGGVKRVGGVLTSPLTLLGLGGGIGGLTKMGIDLVVERENITMAFKTMLGSADAAKKRVEELTKFAGQTPFSRDDIYESSRVLEVFTKGALSTSKGLRLVGDVAAGTKQPYKDVALWVGRLYDAMAAGRPVGEMTARLQEMGAIGGEQRDKLEQLAKSGKKISQTWPEAEKVFGRFGGQMEKMSHGLGNMFLSTKSFFKENIIMRWGKGVESVMGPLLEKFRTWRNEHPEAVKKIGDTVERIAEKATWKVVEFFEGAYNRIKTIIESPEFKNAEFGEKVRMLVEVGLDDVITWLDGPGKEKMVSVFTSIGEASAKAYVEVMKTLGEKSIEELKKGNITGAAIPAAAMWMLGGGALLKGGIGAGKGIWNAGKWAKGKLPLRTATAGGAAAETAGLSKGFNIKQLLRGWFGPASPPINKQNILARPEPGYKPVGKRFWENIDLSKVENRDKIVSLHNTGKLGRYKELEKAFGKLPGGGTPAKSMVSSIMGKLGDVKSGNWAPLKYIGKFGKVGSFLSRWSVPLALGTGAAEVALSRPENRLQTGLNVGGRLAGGAAGATLGAKAGAGIGTFFGPGIGNLVGGAVGGLGGGIAGAIGGEALVKKISGWVDKIDFGALAASVGDFFTKTIPKGWNNFWGSVGDFFTSNVPNWWGGLTDKVSTFFTETVPEKWSEFWDGVGNFFTETIPYALGYAVGRTEVFFTQSIPKFFGNLWNGITTFFTATLPTWASDTWNNSIVPFFTQSIPNFFVGLWSGIITFFTSTLPTWATNIWSNSIVPFFTQTIPGFFSSLWSAVTGFFTQTLPSLASTIWGSIKNFFTSTIPSFFESLWGKVKGSFGAGYTAGKVKKHAYGGIITRPHIGMVAEAGPEAIIPLSTRMRGRAIDLYERVGRMLGVKPYAFGGLAGAMQQPLQMAAPIPTGALSPAMSGATTVNLNFDLAGLVGQVVIENSDDINGAVDKIAGTIADNLRSIFQNMTRK